MDLKGNLFSVQLTKAKIVYASSKYQETMDARTNGRTDGRLRLMEGQTDPLSLSVCLSVCLSVSISLCLRPSNMLHLILFNVLHFTFMLISTLYPSFPFLFPLP